MKRYHRRGGFHHLTSMASALSISRLALLALGLCLFKKQKILMLCLLATLPLDFFAHRLMNGYDLLTSAALILDGAADLAIATLAALLASPCRMLLRIPAWFLFVLSILSLVRKICRIKQAAVL